MSDTMLNSEVLDLLKTEVNKSVAEAVTESTRKQQEAAAITPAWFSAFTSAHQPAVPQKDPDHLGRVLWALAASRVDEAKAVDLARKSYDGAIRDAVVKTLTASVYTSGGSLVPTDTASEIIEYLRPAAVIRRLGARVLPMPNGNLTIGSMTGGATATYYGEAASATASQGTTGSVVLSAKKLITIVPISKDLLRTANPLTDQMIREDAIGAMAAKEDACFIRSDGTAAQPKGLKYWTPSANITTVNATVNLANVTTDLGKLVLNLLNADCRMTRPAWIIAPRTWYYLVTVRDSNGNFAFRNEMLSGPQLQNGVPSGTLFGYPYGVTTQIPITIQYTGSANESEVYLADLGDAIIGDTLRMTVELGDGVAYYNSDGTLTGGFSRDEVALKIVAEHDFAMRHTASVTYAPDCDWGA